MSLKHLIVFAVFFLLVKFGFAQTNQIPQFNSTQEKEAWIQAHPLEYQQILAADSASSQSNATVAAQANQTNNSNASGPSGQVVDAPAFPQYVNTGDKAKDDADYAAAKAAWIQQHPELYQQMSGQPH